MSKKTTKKTESRKASPRKRRSEAGETQASPSPEQIRERAYQIFRSGANPSDPLADWFQAERELKGGPRP